MNPVYHWQTGSFIAAPRSDLRERRLIMLASLAPDLDGVFFWDQELWQRMHHTFSHNIFFAALVSAVLAAFCRRGRRAFMFAVCFGTAALQLVFDNLTNHPSWRQQYLWPLSSFEFGIANFIEWQHMAFLQERVIQISFMVLILAGTVFLYRRTGRTFLELISPRFDRLITGFVTLPFYMRCSVCGARAFYREDESGAPLCPRHARVRPNLSIEKYE